jgi:Domain of unknown function (DUF4383)
MNDRTPVQNAARLAGLVFLLVGIAGFVPGVTTNLYDGLDFAGDGSEAELLGLFQVSVLHNIVHLLFGAGLFMAGTPEGARTYLLGAGGIYLVLFVLGLVGAADWVPANDADDWLHLLLGVGLLGAGLALGRDRGRPAATA